MEIDVTVYYEVALNIPPSSLPSLSTLLWLSTMQYVMHMLSTMTSVAFLKKGSTADHVLREISSACLS